MTLEEIVVSYPHNFPPEILDKIIEAFSRKIDIQ